MTFTLKNLTGMDISVQGYTVVRGVQQRGAIYPMKKMGGKAIEQTHAGTTRYYTVSDPLQPARIYLPSFPVNVPNQHVVLKIMVSPTNPKMIVITPAPPETP